MRPRPWTLLVAAAAQALEAVGVLVAAVVSAVDTASGHSYQRSSGIALTVLAFAAAIAVAFVVPGLLRVRLWSRTPALFTQLFVGTTGVYLLDAHHLNLGLPAVVRGHRRLRGHLRPGQLAGPQPPGPAGTRGTGHRSPGRHRGARPAPPGPAQGRRPGRASKAAAQPRAAGQPQPAKKPPSAAKARPTGSSSRKASTRRR